MGFFGNDSHESINNDESSNNTNFKERYYHQKELNDKLNDENHKLISTIWDKDAKIISLNKALETNLYFKNAKHEIKNLRDKLIDNKQHTVLHKIAQIEVRLEENTKKGEPGWYSSDRDDDYSFILDNLEYITEYFKSEGIQVAYNRKYGSVINFFPKQD